MRKLFFLATAVAMLVSSCQNTEILNEVKNPMGFQAGIGKQTKALAESGEDQLKSQGFRLWAYNATTNAIYSDITNIKISYTTDKWAAAAGKSYYWPGIGNQLDFYSVSQDETEGKGAGTIKIDSIAGTITISDFTVPTTADNDLMIAAKITQSEDETDKGGAVLKPVFGHILTKVAFNFNQDETSLSHQTAIVVKSIATTSDLVIKGTYNTTDWTLQTAEKEGFNETRDLTLTSTSQNFATWLLMPQSLTNGDGKQEVTINYTVNGVANTKKFNLFQTGKIETWAINQFVSYNIMISPTAISFNPSVDEWTPITDNEIKY